MRRGPSCFENGGIWSFRSHLLHSWLQGTFLQMLASLCPTLSFHLSRGHSYLSSWMNLKVVPAYLCNVSAPSVPDLIKTAHLLFAAGDFSRQNF